MFLCGCKGLGEDELVNAVILRLNALFFNQFQSLMCSELAVLLQSSGGVNQKSVVICENCIMELGFFCIGLEMILFFEYLLDFGIIFCREGGCDQCE